MCLHFPLRIKQINNFPPWCQDGKTDCYKNENDCGQLRGLTSETVFECRCFHKNWSLLGMGDSRAAQIAAELANIMYEGHKFSR